MAPRFPAQSYFDAIPDPAVVVEGGRVVAVNAALVALMGGDVEQGALEDLLAERAEWLAERLPSAHATGEALRLHVRTPERQVPVDVRVGQTACGAWVLVGRDATSAVRVGAVVGGLTSLYAQPSEGTGIPALLEQSHGIFGALGWNIAVWRVDEAHAVLEHVWLTERAREHAGVLSSALIAGFTGTPVALDQAPLIAAAVREGRGSTIDDFPAVLEGLAARTPIRIPIDDREAFARAGFVRGATAPVFVDGRVRYVVGVVGTDVDERDSAGVQLFASMLSVALHAGELGTEMARQQRHAALGQMSRQLAHEVRNPLAVILQASRQARKGDAEQSGKMLDMIDEEARRLERLMGDLVSFAGPLTLRVQETRLGEIVRWSLEALSPQERHSALREQVDQRLSVLADPMLLRQALSHLLHNACSHARDHVHISAFRKGDRAVLRIENDGGPLPTEVADRVFEPFFSTRPTGTGLGLAVVRRLIEDQGGTVELDAADDAIVFRVVLPAAT